MTTRWANFADICGRRLPAGTRIGVNAMFTRNRLDAWRMRAVHVDQSVLHTANPMDDVTTDRVMIPSAYETRGDYGRRMLRTLRMAA